jgi:hypothetical protein
MLELNVVATVGNQQKKGKIEQVGPGGVSVKLLKARLVEVFPYIEIVKLLMASAKEKAQESRKFLVWPAPNSIGKLRNVEHQQNKLQSNGANEADMQKSKRLQSDGGSSPSKVNKLKDGAGNEKSVPLWPFLGNPSVELVRLVAPSPGTVSDVRRIVNIENLHEMDPSTAKAFWNALNSKESFFGSELLRFTSKAFNEVPRVELFRNLVELVSFGPMYNKTCPFSDVSKMELAFHYLSSLMTVPECATKLAESTLPKYWMDCLCQVTRATHCEIGDESRVTVAALRRVGHSLQVSAYCEELFGKLLDFQLKEFKADSKLALQKEYRSKAVLRPMLDNCDGTRQLLKSFTRATAHVLICYGHHILGNTSLEPESSAMYEAKDLCHTQAMRLVSALGKILVNLVWLYSVESDSDKILALDCATLMQDAFDAVFLEKQFDPLVFLGLPKGKAAEKIKAKHWDRVKFHFVVSLDGPLSMELRKFLAQRLGIQSLYDLCYGDMN